MKFTIHENEDIAYCIIHIMANKADTRVNNNKNLNKEIKISLHDLKDSGP